MECSLIEIPPRLFWEEISSGSHTLLSRVSWATDLWFSMHIHSQPMLFSRRAPRYILYIIARRAESYRRFKGISRGKGNFKGCRRVVSLRATGKEGANGCLISLLRWLHAAPFQSALASLFSPLSKRRTDQTDYPFPASRQLFLLSSPPRPQPATRAANNFILLARNARALSRRQS